jgi:hypothetical protein
MYGKFKVKVKYTKQLDDGTFKRVTEAFLLDAMTFSDAETRIYEQMGNLIKGEFSVTGITKESIQEIIHDEGFETWFKATVKFFSSTDDGSKAKVVSHTVLCQSENVEMASKNIKEFYETVGISVEVNSCGKSDVLEYFILDPEAEIEKSKEFFENAE